MTESKCPLCMRAKREQDEFCSADCEKINKANAQSIRVAVDQEILTHLKLEAEKIRLRIGSGEFANDPVTMLKRLCCDLANDAACLESGALSQEVITTRLFAYSEEIVKVLGCEAPQSLQRHLDKKR